MKKMIVLLVVCSISMTAFSQEKETKTIPNKSFIAELGGPGVLFSANFDTRFKKSPLGFGARLGVGFVSGDESIYDPVNGYYNYRMRSVLTVPFQLNYLFGKPNSVNAFEVGIGATYIAKKINMLDYYNEDATNVLGTASFMYRRMPKDGGFSWRIGFTPLIANGYIQPFGAVSV
ncbi:MAG: hypothetical protein EOP53_08325, partial [Sphingobacteriales bacterium]